MIGALVTACLLPLVPPPYTTMDAERPEYFREVVQDRVPAGSVLLGYPFPGPLTAETMEWQANADMHYRMVGGYQFVPDGSGGSTLQGNAGATAHHLTELHRGNPEPAVTPALLEEVRAELSRWRVSTVVVVLAAPRSSQAMRFFTEVLGRSPEQESGAAVWYELPFGGTS